MREVINIYHSIEVNTRFCESDALGHINSVSYFIYIEQARIDFVLDTGIISKLDGWPFILASAHCDYKKQIYINEKLIVKTFVIEIGRSSFKLGHEIFREGSDELLAYAEAVLVHFDFKQQKSFPIPAEMRNKMEDYLKL